MFAGRRSLASFAVAVVAAAAAVALANNNIGVDASTLVGDTIPDDFNWEIDAATLDGFQESVIDEIAEDDGGVDSMSNGNGNQYFPPLVDVGLYAQCYVLPPVRLLN